MNVIKQKDQKYNLKKKKNPLYLSNFSSQIVKIIQLKFEKKHNLLAKIITNKTTNLT